MLRILCSLLLGPGTRENVDRKLVQQAKISVVSSSGIKGKQTGRVDNISQRPRAPLPTGAQNVAAAPKQAPQPAPAGKRGNSGYTP